MGDWRFTAEQAAEHVRQHCPRKADVSTLGQRPGSVYLCGCGTCPEPDPTPEQLMDRIERQRWRVASEVE